jgi:hypothetical protein
MGRTRGTRRLLFELPVDALFNHRDYVALPAAGRGMLLSLCEHFWRSGCHQLPRDDDQLFALARAHRPTWRHHKAAILQVFEAIRPELERYHRRRENAAAGLAIAAHRGGAANAARLSGRARDQPSSSPPPILVAVPMRAPAPSTAGRPTEAPVSPKRFAQSLARR